MFPKEGIFIYQKKTVLSMLIKKIGGVLQILCSLGVSATSYFVFFKVRPEIKEVLSNVSKIEKVSAQNDLTFVTTFIESGLPSTMAVVIAITLALIALFFLLQGIINLLPDQKKIKEIVQKQEKQPTKKETMAELSNEY